MFFPTLRGGRGAAAVIVVASLCALVATGSASATLPSNCVQAGSTVTCSYSFTGAQQKFKVPGNITVLTVSALGAAGTGTDSAPGGPEGTAGAAVSVTPLSTLYVEVGSSAGWNGGGPGTASGAPGGGASDVRTVSCGATCPAGGNAASLASRLIVAGGGGGSGGPANIGAGTSPGGAGGGSGLDGDAGINPVGNAGGGGQAGGSGTGGGGGSGSDGAGSGVDGVLGLGGAGGAGDNAGGGGGGGGYYGGGGGGGGGIGEFCPVFFFCLPIGDPAGGGGGGSSYAPDGTTSIGDPSLPASVTISYSLGPANTSLPTVTGSAVRGATLTGTRGTWSAFPTSFSYQWLQCDRGGNTCAPVAAGGHALNFVVPGSAVDGSLELQVTATNVSGSTQATSAPFVIPGPVPTNSAAPTVGALPPIGNVITGTRGTWTHAPTSFAYQWEMCDSGGNNCGPIPGAHSLNYTVTPLAIGHTLALQVTASNADGQGSPATSAPTSAVPGDVPINSAVPTTSGTVAVGSVLTGTRGSWNGSVASYGYQWERCGPSGNGCGPIPGGNGLTYTVHTADAGTTIELWVTAINGAGTSPAAQSAPTIVVPGSAPANVSAPTVSGTVTVGSPLTGTRGTWANAPTSFSFQWERCDTNGDNCTAIPAGGNGLSYTPHAADVGFTLELWVTAGNTYGTSDPAESAPVTLSP